MKTDSKIKKKNKKKKTRGQIGKDLAGYACANFQKLSSYPADRIAFRSRSAPLALRRITWSDKQIRTHPNEDWVRVVRSKPARSKTSKTQAIPTPNKN